MKEEEILEGNKLIAEFMEAKRIRRPDKFTQDIGYKFKQRPDRLDYRESRWWKEDELEYHLSWDWLITVVRKIYSLEYESFYMEVLEQTTLISQIEYVWKAVVDVLKEYNLENSKSDTTTNKV